MIYFQLFYTFFLIGLLTFGGGYAMIPMIQEQVMGNGWMELNQLTDFIAISEATPGPFAINIATFVGNQTGGVLGAISATIGVILPSFIIILIVALIMSKFLNNKYVKGALGGVRPVVLALILSTALVFFIRSFLFNGDAIYSHNPHMDRRVFTMLISIVGFMIIYKKVYKKSLGTLWILFISAMLGLIVYI